MSLGGIADSASDVYLQNIALPVFINLQFVIQASMLAVAMYWQIRRFVAPPVVLNSK